MKIALRNGGQTDDLHLRIHDANHPDNDGDTSKKRSTKIDQARGSMKDSPHHLPLIGEEKLLAAKRMSKVLLSP